MNNGVLNAERGRQCYGALGIPECSPLEVVKKRFKEMALRCHPDKNLDDPLAEDRFKQLTHVYEVLSNPDKKRIIDNALVAAGHTLSQPQDLQSAASIFRKQHTHFHDELQAFRMKRRTQSSSNTRSSSMHGNDVKASQYTPEQTEYFRQRELEREKELRRKLERERELQREQELERYRQAQEERLREEERKAREARAKLEKAEASLQLHGLNRTNGSFSGARRRDTSLSRSRSHDRSSVYFDASSVASSSSPLGSTAPRLGNPCSSGMSTPRPFPSAVNSPLAGQVRGTSPVTEVSPFSPVDVNGNSAGDADDAKKQERLKKERERQEEVRRQEQDRYIIRKLQEAKQQESRRAKEAAELEARHYSRELQLLVDNEQGERTQFLMQEEELERRLLMSSFRGVERLVKNHANVAVLRNQVNVEKVELSQLEQLERTIIQQILLQEAVKRCLVCEQEAREHRQLDAAALAGGRQVRKNRSDHLLLCDDEHVCRQSLVAVERIQRVVLHVSCVDEVTLRDTLQRDESRSRQRIHGIAHASLLTSMLLQQWRCSRVAVENECVGSLGLIRVTCEEEICRRNLVGQEIDDFVHIQRLKGEGLASLVGQMRQRALQQEARIASSQEQQRCLTDEVQELKRLLRNAIAAADALRQENESMRQEIQQQPLELIARSHVTSEISGDFSGSFDVDRMSPLNATACQQRIISPKFSANAASQVRPSTVAAALPILNPPPPLLAVSPSTVSAQAGDITSINSRAFYSAKPLTFSSEAATPLTSPPQLCSPSVTLRTRSWASPSQ